jgi:hypothetical protein
MSLGSHLNRWSIVLTGVVLGIVFAAVDLVQGVSPVRAAIAFAIVAGYALAISAFRSRSETASALAGHPVDERWQAINLRAVAVAGQTGAFAALAGFLIAEATGHDGSQFAVVGAAVGLSYILAVVWFRLRG